MKSHSLEQDVFLFEGSESALERMLIDSYLKDKGISSIQGLSTLSKEDAKRLMLEACRYASLKLAEIESMDRLQRELHQRG